MPKKNSHITVTDQFCGCGGSSSGVQNYSNKIGGGVEIKLALNHWKLAIETHNTNFPDTIHECTDISACDPRRYPSTDILITSPECTNHTLAKGVKIIKKQMDMFAAGIEDAAAQRSRATMWDVCRFAEYHNYNCIIVENVVDAKKWVMFDAWIIAMHALGYNHKCVYLNSMFCYPTPQSRDRMYIVFWKKGNKVPMLDYTPKAWCHKCNKDILAIQTWKDQYKQSGKYKQQYVYCCSICTSIVSPYYYAAFNCIDWSDVGTRIGDRKKPLSDNTIKRIEYGLKKYGKEPFQVINYSHGYSKSILDSTATLTTNDHHGIVQPFIINDQHSTGIDFRVKSVSDKLPTITSDHKFKIITPFIIDDKQYTGINHRVRSAIDSTNTIHTDPRLKIVTPFIIDGNYDAKPSRASSINDELPTNTTHAKLGVCLPFVLKCEHMNALSNVRSVNEEMQTQACRQSMALVSPIVTVMRGNGKSQSAFDALNGVSAGGIHSGILTTEAFNNFLLAYNYNGNQVSHITESAYTVTGTDRISLVSYKEPVIEDCYYRMLKSPEIKLAMAFNKSYTVLGSSKDQVKQLGNAVTPPVMEWLVQQCIESLK